MNQGHRRHGGGGYTLLYYIGLEGKEDRRTKEQKTEEQKNKNRWKGEQEQGGKRTEGNHRGCTVWRLEGGCLSGKCC